MATNNDDKAAEATICVRCKHMATTSLPEVLYAKCSINPVMDYVTGIPEFWLCVAKNNKGTCADYEERGD